MLARWNPWQELFDMQREMSDLVTRAFGPAWFPRLADRAGDGGAWTPAIDVFTREGDLVIRAELPGVDAEKDVDISVQDNVLHIRGERRHEERTDDEGYWRVESTYGSFRRSVALPEGVDADDITASYENGILEVVVPKGAELTAPKKIAIGARGSRRALTTKGRRK